MGRDGLHAVKNVIEDKFIVPGAGAFELAAKDMLYEYKSTVEGRAKLGVQAFADALLVVPKVLSENGGYDPNDTVLKLEEMMAKDKKAYVGLDISNGEGMDPTKKGIFDNYRVKRQMVDSSAIIATQLLLVDEVMRAGRKEEGLVRCNTCLGAAWQCWFRAFCEHCTSMRLAVEQTDRPNPAHRRASWVTCS